MRNYKRLEFRSKQTEKAQLENFADMSKSLALRRANAFKRG